MNILRINSSDAVPIRKDIFRSEFDYDEHVSLGDDEEQTFHLGVFVEGKLVSVASFYYENNEHFPSHKDQYRLRGMATLPQYQNIGLSKALLQTAFSIIKRNMCTLLWCHARQVSVPFYQKLGFDVIGEEFDVPKLGSHRLVSKDISSHSDMGSYNLKQ